jgi:hypothetical protein
VETRNAYTVLAEKPLGTPRRALENNIELYLREMDLVI